MSQRAGSNRRNVTSRRIDPGSATTSVDQKCPMRLVFTCGNPCPHPRRTGRGAGQGTGRGTG